MNSSLKCEERKHLGDSLLEGGATFSIISSPPVGGEDEGEAGMLARSRCPTPYPRLGSVAGVALRVVEGKQMMICMLRLC